MNQIRMTIATLSVAGLAFAACGGSDDAGSGVQKELADEAMSLLSDQDEVSVDEDCVRDIINDLSDEEATEGLAALTDPDSDSEAFDLTGEKIEDECFSEG